MPEPVLIPEPQGEPEPANEGGEASHRGVDASGGTGSGGVGALGDPASVGALSAGARPPASGLPDLDPQPSPGGYLFGGEWHSGLPRNRFEETWQVEEAQRRSMQDLQD